MSQALMYISSTTFIINAALKYVVYYLSEMVEINIHQPT